MFQPTLRAFQGDGSAAIAGPFPGGVSLEALKARIDLSKLDHLDLVVDLGHDIGSRTWWRGFATLAGLLWAGTTIAFQPAPMVLDVPPALLPSQVAFADAARIQPLALGGTTGAEVGPTARVKRLAEPPERPRIEVTARIGRVDSLGGALRRAGVGADDVAKLTSMLGGAVNLRSVRPGTPIDLVLGRRESKSVPRPLESLALRAAFDLKLEVARNAEGALVLKRIPIAVDDTPLRVSGTVGSSLYRSARAAGLPGNIVAEAMKQLGHAIDIQRDVRSRDRFDLVVEYRRAETGETEVGRLLYAAVDGRKDAAVMRWGGGNGQFFLPDGSSAKKGLMRTPVDGARLSSGFGMRLHPILGYSRLHKGIDFAASYGTPIMAAASGVVEAAFYHRGYGNFVRLKHSGGYGTGYAHMSRFTVRPGQRVEQGQVIGFVGSTGLSTGPHLHYEVYVNGKAVDPRQAKFRGGSQLVGGELSRFKAQMNRLKALRPATSEVADSGGNGRG